MKKDLCNRCRFTLVFTLLASVLSGTFCTATGEHVGIGTDAPQKLRSVNGGKSRR